MSLRLKSESPSNRKGQFSVYLKPIIIVIMAVLLVALLTSSLDFGVQTQKERIEYELDSQAPKIKNKILKCLSVSENYSSSGILINYSKLREWNKEHKYSEPTCAEDFDYGWNATIEEDFLGTVPGEREKQEKANLMLVIDVSGSMAFSSGGKSKLEVVKSAAKDFVDETPENYRMGIAIFSSSGHIRQSLTTDKDKLKNAIDSITPLGSTAIGYGIEEANNELKGVEGDKIEIIFSDGREMVGSDPVGKAKEAKQNDIKIYTIGTGDADKGLLESIAGITDGKMYFVDELNEEKLRNIFEAITTVFERDVMLSGSGDSTCTIPPVVTYEGKADIVFASDSSISFANEWETLCGKIKNSLESIKDRGLDAEVTVYGPKQPGGPESGTGVPMEIYSGKYWDEVPPCMDKFTSWNASLLEYDSSRDYGLEAWGMMAEHILVNHEWRGGLDSRILVLLGDQDPTGGRNNENTWRNKSEDFGEIDLVERLENLSEENNVSVYTVYPKGGMEYRIKTMYGSEKENDAIELMERLSKSSGGISLAYENIHEIVETIEDIFKVKEHGEVKPCNVSYSFGETQGSQGRSLDGSIVMNFPVSIRHSDDLRTPGDMILEVRKGDLETLSGAINRVYTLGKERKGDIERNIEIDLDSEVYIDNVTFQRLKEVEYTLSGGKSPDKNIEVDEDFRFGVNGLEILYDNDGVSTSNSTAEYRGDPITFEGIKGDSLQIMAFNTKDPELKLSPLYLHCCGDVKNKYQKVADSIYAHINNTPEAYKELGGIGLFYDNFTSIEIGETEEYHSKGLCIRKSNGESCVDLKNDDINNIDISPGRHYLKIRYKYSEGEIEVIK